MSNFDAKRDWGHARDDVEVQWLMLQQEKPEYYVIATGQQYSVQELIEVAAAKLEIPIEWAGEGAHTKGFDPSGRCIVRIDPRYFRPEEVETLLGDASKARKKLGWAPKITFDELVAEMVEGDLKLAERDALVVGRGYKAYSHNE